jgi:hypothetical protein
VRKVWPELKADNNIFVLLLKAYIFCMLVLYTVSSASYVDSYVTVVELFIDFVLFAI